MSRLIGLTGSIGMGKSTTAAMFSDLGIPVWDADHAVHRLYSASGEAVPLIAEVFPAVVVNGAVSRKKLKEHLAENPQDLEALEQIVHPLVAEDRKRFIEASDSDLLIFDIPLLFETGADQWLDTVVVVSAPPELQRDRVLARPGMTPQQFDFILSKQTPDAEKRTRADYVIETIDLTSTRAQVQELVQTLRNA